MGIASAIRERAPGLRTVPGTRTPNLLEFKTSRPQGGPHMAGTPQQKAAPSEDRPKWVPLREDQHAELAALARELMHARSRKVERITENTVIRVAVDLLIRHPEFLGGDTEDELRTTAIRRVEELLERERQLLAGRTPDDKGPGESQ